MFARDIEFGVSDDVTDARRILAADSPCQSTRETRYCGCRLTMLRHSLLRRADGLNTDKIIDRLLEVVPTEEKGR